MESKPPKSDPLPLLLNEIDILLAQSRLVELYLKQSQAAALFERQSERERHEAELVNLRAALARTEQALATAQQAADARDHSLREEARRLARAIDETRQEIEQRAVTLDRAEAANAELRLQLSRSQSAGAEAQAAAQQSHAAQRALESEIIALRARLEEDQRSSQSEQLAARALSEEQQKQILQLQSELAAKIGAAREAENELRLGRGALEDARGRMAELEQRREQERTHLVREGERTRAQLTDEIERLKGALDEREKAFAEIRQSVGVAEQSLRSEILNLRGEFEEKQKRIEIRDEELRLARVEISALRERAAETEKNTAALNQVRTEELADLRRSHEDELAELRHEVARRERALTERQEAVSAVELALHGKNQVLQGELARSRGAIAEHESAAQQAKAELISLREQLRRKQAAASVSDEHNHALEAELSRLTQELTQRESSFAENEGQRAALESNLRGENQHLQAALAEQRSIAEGAYAEVARARAEIAAVEEQRLRLEQAQNELEESRRQEALIRQELENRLQAKDDELRALGDRGREQIALALQAQEARFKSVEDEKLREISQLQDRVQGREFAEQQSHAEIVRLRGQIADLEEQRTGLENSGAELGHRLDQANASSRELEARLESIESERQKQIADSQSGLDERNRSHETLSRELERVRAEYAFAEEKIAGAQASHRAFEQNYQSVLGLHQETEARLRAKELELDSARADTGTLRQQLDEKITGLQLDLAEKQLLIESRAAEIAHLKAELGRAARALAERESAAQALAQSQGELQRLDAEHRAALAALNAERESERQENERKIEDERRRAEEAAQNFHDLEERARQLSLALEERQRELKAAGDEGAVSRSRLEQLEARHAELAANAQAAHELRAKLETEVAAARSEIEQKNWASAQQQVALENLALAHKSQIEKHESRIAEQQHNVRERDEEIERFKSQLRLRDERIESLSTELCQTERTAIDRAVEIKEEYGVRIADLERQIAQKDSELQVRTEAEPEMEQTLRREVDRLVHEIQERNQILQDRNDELVRVKADADALRERFTAVETAATEAESAFNSESEGMRVEFQAQIALLQAELSQKEWADAERQAETHGLEENYRREIEGLRQKLSQSEAELGGRQDFVFDDKPLAVAPKNPAVSGNGNGHVLSPTRRWQSGFGWKRRWKSS